MVPLLERLEARALPSFLPTTYYPIAFYPRAAVAGDLNGDGQQDLAAIDVDPHVGLVRVWLGRGDGTLQTPPTTLISSVLGAGLVLGDFNNDNRPDLALATGNHPDTLRGRGVHVFLGRGDGSFEPPRSLDPGAGPLYLMMEDLNRDGQQDLVVTISNYPGPRGFRVLLGRGDGTFTALPIYNPSLRSVFTARGDFNADGHLDLVGVFPDWNEVWTLLGRGDGTFQEAGRYAAGRSPQHVVADDFNGDGHKDVAVVTTAYAPQDDGSVGVLLGRGDGSFQAVVRYPIGREARALNVGDFNRDGLADLATTYLVSSTDSVVGILLGRGDGTFHDPDPYPAPAAPWALAVGDFNGDDHPDLAVALRLRVGIFLNDGIWPNRPVVHFYVYPAAGQVTTGTPFDISVLALNALYGLVPGYTGSVGVFTTDPVGTPPFVYQFRASDQGVAAFPRGLTLRTPGQQRVYVYDTATFEVYGSAVFDVVTAAPGPGGGKKGQQGEAARPALDLHASAALDRQGVAGVNLPPTGVSLSHAEPPLAPPAAARPAARDALTPPALLDRLFARRDESPPWDRPAGMSFEEWTWTGDR